MDSNAKAKACIGTHAADVDDEGYLDLILVNLHAQADSFYRNEGEGFRDNTSRVGLGASSRAAAFEDFDGDGGMDVVVMNRDGRAHVLINTVAERGHWLRLRVLDREGRDAIGASVTAMYGARSVRRDVVAAYSYCAANDPRAHMGHGSGPRTRHPARDRRRSRQVSHRAFPVPTAGGRGGEIPRLGVR